MIEAGPDADLAAMVVWIEMLPEDPTADLLALTGELAHPLIHWFHDPKQRAGRAIAGVLGAADLIAWDVYLFYDRQALWEQQQPPAPQEWVHQLDDPQADPARRSGDRLEPELARLAKQIAVASPRI